MTTSLMRNSTNAPLPVADYAHAVEVPLDDKRSMLYLCGMGPRDKTTNLVPGVVKDAGGKITDYDIAAQTRNVFQNIDTVIKDAGGRGLRDVVDVQVFLVDIPRDFKAFNAAWKEFMVASDGWMPTRTTVQVAALPLPEIFVELKCVAVINRSQA
ncbi:MAG TPA: RidA family protein [Alphaproteobacteria bacterium]|nr:RidA family protein [Alphaproteobacteria bacterium]